MKVPKVDVDVDIDVVITCRPSGHSPLASSHKVGRGQLQHELDGQYSELFGGP